MSGRAGRRGIDDHGSAVVLWSPWVRFDQVAELATSRMFHLRSVFRPTYNMAANLVRTYDSATAHQLLALSFAQFQSDRDVVRIERRLQRRREKLAELRDDAASPFGDIDEYRQAAAAGRGAANGRDHPYELALMRMKPGAVLHVSKGKHHGPAAVVATALRELATDAGTRMMASHWERVRTLRVVRREPYVTAAAKIQPLHIERSL